MGCIFLKQGTRMSKPPGKGIMDMSNYLLRFSYSLYTGIGVYGAAEHSQVDYWGLMKRSKINKKYTIL